MKFLFLSFSIALFSCAAPQMMVPENNYKLNPPAPVYRYVWALTATDLDSGNYTAHNQASKPNEDVNLSKLELPDGNKSWNCLFSKTAGTIFIHCNSNTHSMSAALYCPAISLLNDSHNHQGSASSFIIRSGINPNDLNKGALIITVECEAERY